MYREDNTTFPSGIVIEETNEMFAREIRVNEFDRASNTILPFNQDVTVFLATTASYVDSLDGDEIDDSAEYCDVGRGLFSSVKEMIGSKPKSDKLLRTITISVMKTMFVKAESEDDYFASRGSRIQAYHYLPRDWFHIDEPLSLDDLIVWAAGSTEQRLSDGRPETYEPKCIAQITFGSDVDADEQVRLVAEAANKLREEYGFSEEAIFPAFRVEGKENAA